MLIKKSYQLQKSCKFIRNTPLEFSERLSKIYNCNIFLKREDLQNTRSFKIRGSFNKISKLSKIKQSKGIVTASAGNHAQGVAYICSKLNIKNDIYVPNTTPLQKIDRIKTHGNGNCNLNIFGDYFDESLKEALEYTKKNNKIFVHPYNDIDIIAGQGAISYEICNELEPDIIVSSIGGGGLISGLYLGLKEQNIKCSIYGTEPIGAMSMYNSIKLNKIIKLENIDTFVDGASVAKVGSKTFEIVNNNLENIFGIDNNELCYDIINMYQEDGIITEPAGALSVSGLRHIDKNKLKGKNVVCIVSGGNNDIKRYNEYLEKSLIYQNLKHYFIIEFSQKPGELKNFIKYILGPDDDITMFEYLKKNSKSKGTVIMGIEIGRVENINQIINNLQNHNYCWKKLEENDLLYKFIL